MSYIGKLNIWTIKINVEKLGNGLKFQDLARTLKEVIHVICIIKSIFVADFQSRKMTMKTVTVLCVPYHHMEIRIW